MSTDTSSPGSAPRADGTPGRPRRGPATGPMVLMVVLAAGAVALAAYGVVSSRGSSTPAAVVPHHRPVVPATLARPAGTTPVRPAPTSTTTGAAPTTSTTVPTTTPTSPPTTAPTTTSAPAHGPVTSPPLPPPGPGFNEGQVTAVGDSVMVDYETPLQQDIPGINVQAAVSEQWSAGEAELEQLKAAGQLGAVVVVGLSTNGPLASSDIATMMGILSGASRVVFVTTHVDRPWQDPNNALLAAAVHQYPRLVLADWFSLVSQNPGWLYSDETHLPIDGPGAQALAALVASKA